MPKDIAFELIKNSLVVIGSIVFGALLAIFYDQIGEIQNKIYQTGKKFYGWVAYYWRNGFLIGQAIVREILTNPVYDTEREINRIVIYSRDEQNKEQMYERFKNLDDQYGKSKLRYFIGDVRDKDRLKTAMSYDITHVIHTAALKIVPIAEYNPFEVVKN